MLLASAPLASIPLAAGPRLPRPYRLFAPVGEYGWGAWSFSRQAKLNAWAWHGLGTDAPYAWATMSNYVYMRKDGDDVVHQMLEGTYYDPSETVTDSLSVEATSQWIDMGKPGQMKALTGIDFDGINVDSIEVYIAIDGDRDGQLADTIAIGDNAGGWTYSGEIIPVDATSTEFKLRFIGDSGLEVQINRLTLWWEPVQG